MENNPTRHPIFLWGVIFWLFAWAGAVGCYQMYNLSVKGRGSLEFGVERGSVVVTSVADLFCPTTHLGALDSAIYPELRLTHLAACGIRIEGPLSFRALKPHYQEIEDTFELCWDVISDFPRAIPLVFEVGGRIPANYHKLDNGALCLGSPLRQRLILSTNPTLSGFVEALVIPYLYNRSYIERYQCLPLGELDHGLSGLIRDYQQLFGVVGSDECVRMLQLLGMKKRSANKNPCPCGSGRRVGRCHNRALNPLREIATRRYFRDHGAHLQNQINRSGASAKDNT
ncbi:MAG: hypothetical protein V4819_23265 [Verrucomicrobiota bacterium]